MAKQAVEYEQVAKAAEQLKQQGKEPSLTNVAETLGLVSQPNHLVAMLEQWYKTQPEFKRSIDRPLSDNITITAKEVAEKNVELEKSLSLLRATLESTADGIMMVNGHGKVVDWNQKFVEMWRIPSRMLEVGTESISFDYILAQLKSPDQLIKDVEFLYNNPEWQGELSILHFKDGRIFERFTQPQRVGNDIVGRVYSFRDITQRSLKDDELRIRERAIEASSHGVVIVDISKSIMPIIYVNKAFERITGFTDKQVLGQNLAFIYANKLHQTNLKRLDLAFRELREETVEIESYRQNGEAFWSEISVSPVSDAMGKVRHYVCIINDITQRRDMEKQLLKQATHDSLTELPNRVLLIDRVEQAILHAKKKKSIFAFLFLDLDRFKLINDSLGHSVGDKLLQAVANRLLIATEDADTVARLGGDEFIILLQEITTEKAAQNIAENILEKLATPFQIMQHNLKITGSIGISYYPKDGSDYELLMKNADLSMYNAKDSGRNAYRIYDKELNRQVINRMQLDNALRDSLKRQEFYLVYQPLIDLTQNKLTGFEALIRWQSHLLGHVPPVNFIGTAEENGLIIEIGRWVLEEACTQLKRWHDAGFNTLSMAVNISGRQFRQTRLAEIVQEILEKTQLSPQFLELELTESLLVDDLPNAIKTMQEIKSMGVRLVIDDFGTGYSSLSYLKQFPVDKLKIDRSFIIELEDETSEAAIARAIINLGHSLNLKVLAEGIETKVQLDYIIQHGCDYAQGYYFSPPKQVHELMPIIKQYS
ncbi:MAG: histidine kinase [Legionellaceae bacterium]|nr:histidine kinase [Legionellaceae bacterium]HAF86965.1 histidine kinase [Legionellales bacterium]|tara:strand:- start:549 stop:2849 length:2301 start_codon:yes stop_codon:yes gene_type:complete